jgi:hypothetical protein
MSFELACRRVQISLAAFPGLRHLEAAQLAIGSSRDGMLQEPCFGEIGCEHVQLVPQSFGHLDAELCECLMLAFPETQFRLHANVRVLPKHTIADVSSFKLYPLWFAQAAQISKLLKAQAYSAHSGRRDQCDMKEMLDNARQMAELFGFPVAIEGQYPVQGNALLVSTWDEYRLLFESGVPYALDLSHLNILAHKSGRRESTLVQEMLACERCTEVHVSDNDGSGDWHQVCESKPWWCSLLPYIHHDAVVFSEGNHRRSQK